MMKGKILNGLLIMTSLFGYLEWGKDNSVFLFQAEAEVISKLFIDPVSSVHPFTILPLVGQALLLITLFQKRPGKVLTYTGMAGIAVLLIFMFMIGIIGLNYRIVFSTIPFLIVSLLTVHHLRRS